MKLEISPKDLIVYLLILSLFVFCLITSIQIRGQIQNASLVNQVVQNANNIQLLNQAVTGLRKQNAPTFELKQKTGR